MTGSRVYVGGLPYGVRERDLERFFKGFGRIRDVLLKNGYGFVEFDDYRDADDAVYELNGKELLGERIVVEHARGTDRTRGRDRFGGGGQPRRRQWMDKISVERARGIPRGSDAWRDRDRRPPPPRRRSRDRRGPYNSSRRRNDDEYRGNDRYGPPTRTEHRLIVENLSSRVSWQDLKDYMRQAGEVTYADAHKQRRNEGVVEFATYSDMKTAIDKLDDTELHGRRIRLIEDRHRGRGRSRSSSSRSRSRSRSRSHSRRRSPSGSSRSRSRSRSRSNSRAHSKSPSRSKSRDRDSKSKSKSRSPISKKRSRSHSVSKKRSSRERSDSPRARKSTSRSPSIDKNGDQTPDKE